MVLLSHYVCYPYRLLLVQLVGEADEPFLIREHARKFQWGCSDLTVWQKQE